MYKNPKQLIKTGFISGTFSDTQIQPNSLDFEVNSLSKINTTLFLLSNNKNSRILRDTTTQSIVNYP